MSDSQEKDLSEQEVTAENPLKSMLVEYVGNKLKPHDDVVTVGHIVEVLAQEFPDFLLLVAQENFIRGYEQAFSDIESGKFSESTLDGQPLPN